MPGIAAIQRIKTHGAAHRAEGIGTLAILGIVITGPAQAAISSETAYVLNTFSFLIHGVLVMFMAAGFAMLEAGLVRTRNVATICLKNIALYSLAGVMFWAMGYNLMYMDVNGGWLGTVLPWAGDNSATVTGDFSAGYSAESDWFFQMVFVATTASIISGTIAERVRLWPFLLFVAVLAGVYSTPFRVAGSGAVAGWRKWGSLISPAPPSYTQPVAGRHSRVP